MSPAPAKMDIINVVLGYPLRNPGHICVILDPAAQYFWQNTPCSKKLGYICYSDVHEEHLLTQGKALLLFVQLYISDSAHTYYSYFYSSY